MIFLISCLNLESFPWEVRNYVLGAEPCILSDTNTTLFRFTKEKKVWNLTQNFILKHQMKLVQVDIRSLPFWRNSI